MTPDIVVVPHTHWDREWYLPFQRFRMGLVRMLDDVLDAMNADPSHRFTMDGQFAAIEDYLEIRPERRDDLSRLITERRFAAGPWLILADEFLCSGETLIRNLEYGMRGADALGGAMRVGYLPDQFGHCAQMPQILALAGLEHACLWRGVPASVTADAFAWTGADGTIIRTQYLAGSYGNALSLFSGAPDELADRLDAFSDAMRPWRPSGPLLAMYGADHSAPAPGIAAAGLRLATLEEYVTGVDAGLAGLGVVRGELRSHARANILPGVISARIPAKQAMAAAERVVTRYAEPLAALWLRDGDSRGDRSAAARLLDLAWRRLIACAGHDSITGCGADETAQQVAARIAEAGQIGQAVVDLVSASLAARTPRGAVVVANPSPHERTALIMADLPDNRPHLATSGGERVPVQRLEYAATTLDESVMDDLAQLLGRVHERELFGLEIISWSVNGDVFTITVGRHATTPYDRAELRRAILDAAAIRRGPWLVRTLAEPVVTVAAQVTVPPLGRVVLTAVPHAPPPSGDPAHPPRPAPPVQAGALDNGLIRVTVAADGTLSLRDRSGREAYGVGRLVDGGDAGDTYNHAPPTDDVIVEVPTWVTVEEVCSGPLVSAVEVARGYEWPAHAESDSRSQAKDAVVVTTRVELRAGEPYVRLETVFDNRCRDHRVRWHAPAGTAVESFAEGQFAVVRRGLTGEGGCGEEPLPTFPAYGFVAAGGMAVLLDHVTEYELVPAARAAAGQDRELALTVVRSVGYLSRHQNAYRDEPAGPQLATPGAQCAGRVVMRCAVHLYEGTWDEACLPRLAEEYRHDLLAIPGSASGAKISGPEQPGPEQSGPEQPGPEQPGAEQPGAEQSGAEQSGAEQSAEEAVPMSSREGLSIGGEGVIMAALRERDGWLEVRLVAERPVATEAVLRGGFAAARLANALGEPTTPLEVIDGTIRLPLRAFEIATVQMSME